MTMHLLLLILLLLRPSTSTLAPSDTSTILTLSTTLTSPSFTFPTTPDPCAWPKITCSGDRITAIQLGNLSLSGTLPSLSNLTSLTRLELQENLLSGPLPDLSGLKSLQVLLLHGNRFSSVPVGFFGGLSSLQAVSLDRNPFEKWTLPESLKDATNLVNFSANEANLSGRVPEVFGGDNFPGLKTVALAFNDLEGEIPPGFAGSSIEVLWLNGQSGPLSGGIEVVGNMTELVQLWLHSNNFSGPIPDLGGLVNLRDLQLRDNRLTGPVPESVVGLKALKKVTLTNNLLQGPVPEFGSGVDVDMDVKDERFCLPEPGMCDSRIMDLIEVMRPFGYPVRFADSWKGNDPCGGWAGIGCDQNGNVTVINFKNAGLSGSISPGFGRFGSLQKLVLAGNNLTGSVPDSVTKLLNLKEVDLSSNSLSGEAPKFADSVRVNVSGNQFGKDLDPSRKGPSGGALSPGDSAGEKGGNRKSSSASAGVIVGSILGGLALLSVIGLGIFCFYKRKKNTFGRVQSPNTMVIHPRHSGSDPDLIKVTVASSAVNGVGPSTEALSRDSSNLGDVRVGESGNMVISIQVLRNVTNNFSKENILGQGGFGTVYKGELHDGTKIAVKRMESGVMGSKGLTEFQSEIAVLTKVRHRHLVSLLGYCLDGNERLLVYEYMPQGTLSRHLFNWSEEGLRPLEWKKRLSIALDVARGVEYLHSLAHQSFIHRDLKPSNILLGDDMKAKVADFGLVRLAPDGKCSVETRLAGTFGYLAPEYAVTGRVTTKADVFSFGVILMEMITGRKALDESQPEESVHLVTWFRRMYLNKDIFPKAIDPTINLDEETMASVNTIAELAGHCCAREPYQRPDMGHAVNVLSSLAEMWKPTDRDCEETYGIDLDLTLPQALEKWQAFEDSSRFDAGSSSFLASLNNTQTSIPTRPTGFADSFTSADGR